jgi:hypothetical protein
VTATTIGIGVVVVLGTLVSLWWSAKCDVGNGLRRLGDPTGTTELDWVNAMNRNPRSITVLPDQHRRLQWKSGARIFKSITVVFDPNHRFVAITQRSGF